MTVNFHEEAEDSLLQFAVIVSRHQGKWVLCKHKDRDTWEVPGGHREEEEDILTAAKRELFEETGAKGYLLTPICPYSVRDNGEETFGMLYYADITRFDPLPPSEIDCISFFDEMPRNLTYPLIQPLLALRAAEAMAVRI